MLAFFTTEDSTGTPTPWANLILLADHNGEVTLPFGGLDRFNVDTWAPSASALSRLGAG
jgi:hypothetical protein